MPPALSSQTLAPKSITSRTLRSTSIPESTSRMFVWKMRKGRFHHSAAVAGADAAPGRVAATVMWLVPGFLVDDVEQRLALEVALEVLQEDVGAAPVRKGRGGAVVGGDDGVGSVPEGAVRGERLDLVGVEAGARDPALLERAVQRIRVGGAATRDADVVRRRLHRPELGL